MSVLESIASKSGNNAVRCAAMIVVGITEAKRRFEELIEAAERGEHVVVTRYGRPVFDIVKSATATMTDRTP